MSEVAPLLVLGLGNVICGDDGLGVAALSALAERYELPEEVRLLDGGTLGLALLGWLAEADDLLLVDAIRAEAPPGTLVRLEGDQVAPAARERLSVHQIGVADLLDALHLLDAWPSRIALLGLVPEDLSLRVGHSAAVERALPELVEALAREIRERGHALRSRSRNATPCGVDAGDVARPLRV